jgi:hypothetical protein
VGMLCMDTPSESIEQEVLSGDVDGRASGIRIRKRNMASVGGVEDENNEGNKIRF